MEKQQGRTTNKNLVEIAIDGPIHKPNPLDPQRSILKDVRTPSTENAHRLPAQGVSFPDVDSSGPLTSETDIFFFVTAMMIQFPAAMFELLVEITQGSNLINLRPAAKLSGLRNSPRPRELFFDMILSKTQISSGAPSLWREACATNRKSCP